MSTIIRTVALIHIRNKKVLLALCNGKDAFYMPGGKPDKEEDHISALTREVREELGVEVIQDSIQHYGVFEAQAYGKSDGVIVQITCYFADIVGEPLANTEVVELRFFSHDEYKKMEVTAPAVHLILNDLKERGHIV